MGMIKVHDKSVKECILLVPLSKASRLDIVLFIPLYTAAGCFYAYINYFRDNVNEYERNVSEGTNSNSTTGGLYELLNLEILSLSALVLVVTCQLLTFLVAYWSVAFRSWLRFRPVDKVTEALYVCVYPAPHCGTADICELFAGAEDPASRKSAPGGRRPAFEQFFALPKIWFEFHGQKYIEKDEEFYKLDYPVTLHLRDYLHSNGHASKSSLERAQLKWGKNEFEIPLPPLEELFIEQALAPFFLFQVFCVLLWCLDEYWYYSVFTLVMLVLFELTVCKQRQKNLEQLRLMRKPPYGIFVYRECKWTRIMSNELVPGDICSLVKSTNDSSMNNILVPCDMLLLHGSLVLDEAMLTGESVPKVKDSIACYVTQNPDGLTERLDMDDNEDSPGHHDQLIRGGTSIMQHRPDFQEDIACHIPKAPDNGCIAIVLRTGFATSQGTLVRTVLFSTERISVDNFETYVFILVLLVFAVFASGYVLHYGLQDERRSRWKLFLHCTMIITSVVPPELPMELSLAVTTSLARLQELSIFCTEPYRIPIAGKLDICCFDKTGTLTSDNLKVNGIALLQNNDEDVPLAPTSELSKETTFVLAACHQLIRLGNRVEGDSMEKAAVRSVKWSLGKENNVLPRNGEKSQELKIVCRYPFSSELKRMSVIVSTCSGAKIILCKGAPETLCSMYKTAPKNYVESYQKLMLRGKRVLALGYRYLGDEVTIETAKKFPRDEVERELEFAGLLVLNSPLKPDTKQSIEQLTNAKHEVVMITGDNALTACDISRQLKLLKDDDQKIMILMKKNGSIEWVALEDFVSTNRNHKLSFEKVDVKTLSLENDLVISGEALTFLENQVARNPTEYQDILKEIVPYVKVFARVAPSQKEIILGSLKANGLHSLMCGDGTNDVGALKQADIGVSIINSPEMERRARKSRNMIEERLTQKNIDLSPMERLKLELQAIENEQMNSGGMVQLGDASIASPFTSRSTSISATIHIILQGRCTLVTTIQMFKILGLNCLITAYSLTSLYLLGVKQGDTQSTLAGLLIAILFMLLSYAKPLGELSEKRPVSNIFTTPVLLSMFGQFVIHMSTLVIVVYITQPFIEENAEEMAPDADFKPNIINTAVFIIGLCMQVNVFSTNYRGLPYMESLWDNKPMQRILAFTWILTFTLASDVIPGLAELFELVPLPTEEYKAIFMGIMLANTFSVWAWEYIIRRFVE